MEKSKTRKIPIIVVNPDPDGGRSRGQFSLRG